MGRFKDILYDISDILSACCIVGVACIVIWFSIGNIMEYPTIAAAAMQEKDNTNFGLAVPVGGSDATSGAGVSANGTKTDGATSGGGVSAGATSDIYSIYINYGESISTIAQKFVSVGLFKSVEEFNTLVSEKNAASSIKAGNFIIPADSTPEEVITLITTSPGL